MRVLLFSAVLLVGQVWAQAPSVVVAQTLWPNWNRPYHITLLSETCGWPGGAMRAMWQANRTVHWGCWGYNDTGVQIAWSTGHQEHVNYLELGYWNGDWMQQLGYQSLHRRLDQLLQQGIK